MLFEILVVALVDLSRSEIPVNNSLKVWAKGVLYEEGEGIKSVNEVILLVLVDLSHSEGNNLLKMVILIIRGLRKLQKGDADFIGDEIR